MDVGTLNAAIARIQAEVDTMAEIYTPECMDDAHEDGVRDGLILARIMLQQMLAMELDNDQDPVAERNANERYGDWQENPDRTGGQFTQDEIDDANIWR